MGVNLLKLLEPPGHPYTHTLPRRSDQHPTSPLPHSASNKYKFGKDDERRIQDNYEPGDTGN